MKYILFLAVLVNLYSVEYHFYPDGAPLDRCGDMIPGHHVAPIDGPAPYEISVARAFHEEAKSGSRQFKKFYVNIHAKDESTRFKGFLLEARARWDGQSFGAWNTDVKHTKAINCFNRPQTAMTHHYDDDLQRAQSSGFSNVTFLWTAPNSQKLNRVKFIATIVRKFSQIYLNVSTEIKLKEF